MKSLLCLSLLVVAVAADLSQDYQSFNLESNESFNYMGTTLIGYKHRGSTLLEPYLAFNLESRPNVRRSPFGDGFYAQLPILINSTMKVPHSYKILSLRSFSVTLRSGFASWCPSKCSGVSAGAMRTSNATSVVFRCKSKSVCEHVINSLYLSTPDTDMIRKTFKFRFTARADGNNFVLVKKGLPLYKAGRKSLKAFWFESGRLLLYTIKKQIGQSAYSTFTTKGHSKIPDDHSLPDLYRSNYLDKMPTIVKKTGKKLIVFELRKRDEMVVQVKFDATNDPDSLTNTNWFTKSRVVYSYPQTIREQTYDNKDGRFFSVAGINTFAGRRFYINYKWGGCTVDEGFILIADTKGVCDYVNKYWNGKAPAFIYTVSADTKMAAKTYSADRLLVYLE